MSSVQNMQLNNASQVPVPLSEQDTSDWQESLPNEQQNKMFVGGLAQTVTSDFLRAYFSTFGPVQEAFVLMDDLSGRSRGFGFVTFENPQTLKLVLKQKPHILGNKQVDCKHAVTKSINRNARPKGANNPNTSNIQPSQGGAWTSAFEGRLTNEEMIPANEQLKDEISPTINEWSDNDSPDLYLTGGGKSYLALSGDKWLEDCEEADARKIFVGGLPDITPAEFASFFEHFGGVADAMVMFDRKRRRQRGFGFITFATNDGVRNALQYTRHPVKGKLVEVKKAHPLVLQNARAPCKRERDLERMRKAGGSAATNSECLLDPFGLSNEPFLPSEQSFRDSAGDYGAASSLQNFPKVKYPQAPWNRWQYS